MEKSRFLIIIIVLLGLFISFFVIKGNFSPQVIGALLFFLIFVPTLINPDIGLVIIIVSMLFSPEVIVGATSAREVSVRIEDILLLVVIFAWFIRTALTKKIADAFRTPLTAPFFLYIVACFLSTHLALVFGYLDILHAYFSMLKYMEYFLLFLMVKDNLRSLNQSKVFIVVFFLTALFVGMHTNVFIREQIAKGSTFFRTAPPVETRGGGESGTLGGYSVFMMAIAGGIALYSQSKLVKASLTGIILLMFRGFMYTLSRGSYLAFVPMVFFIGYYSKKLTFIYILIVSFILITLFMPHMVKERITGTVIEVKSPEGARLEWEESPRARIDSWKTVIFVRFPKSPIFGHGVGRFFVDSQLFSTLNDVGLLGLSLFAAVFLKLFKTVKNIFNMEIVKNDNFAIGLTVGFLAGFLALLVHAISTNTFIIIRIMEPFWFITAIVFSLPQLLEKQKKDEEEKGLSSEAAA